jgi:hypothetical protein
MSEKSNVIVFDEFIECARRSSSSKSSARRVPSNSTQFDLIASTSLQYRRPLLLKDAVS